MKHIVVWGVSVLCALSAVLAGQIGTRQRVAPPPSFRPGVIRVPEDVATLQQAIWLSEPGGLILVKGTHDPVTIDRPLTIVGDPVAAVDQYCTPVGIELRGTGGVVTLVGLHVYGWSDCVRQTGIEGGGFSELHLYDSQVVSNLYAFGGLGYGGPAIDVTVPLVVLSDVHAKASQPDVNDCIGLLPDMKHAAVEAPNSTVIVVDSTLEGGDGGWFCCNNCSCPPSLDGLGGEGGDVIVADQVFVTNSTLTPGSGSTYFAHGASGTLACGTQKGGVAVIANSHVTLANDLEGPAHMHLASPYTLTWSLPGPSVWIWVADDVQEPAPIGVDGWSFLTPSATVFLGAFPTPPGSLTLVAPPSVSWLGERLAFQAASLDGTVSRPVLSVVTD